MPPPEPRSSTVSPTFNSISAVGLPQPSDAATAVSGSVPRSLSLYRFSVISSGPQQLASFAPEPASRAAAPYFSWICSFKPLVVSMVCPLLNSPRRIYGAMLYLSRRIYDPAGSRRSAVQGSRGCDAVADSGASGWRRDLRLRDSRRAEAAAADRLAPPCVPPARGPGRDAAGRAVD